MTPVKSDSFSFRRNTSSNSSNSSNRSCRRNLQETFDEKSGDKSVLSVLSLNENTRKVLRNGADRISKTFNNVRTTFGSITQRFKMSTKRRQILEEGPMTPNCATPQTFSKQILGRTPEKLYSPFGIESPYCPTTYVQDKENRAPFR